MSTGKRSWSALLVLLLAAGSAGFCVLQLALVAKSCGDNLPAVGTEGSGLVREVDGSLVRCEYKDIAGRDFDFVINVMPTLVCLILTSAIALIALAEVVSGVRRRGKGHNALN